MQIKVIFRKNAEILHKKCGQNDGVIIISPKTMQIFIM